MELSRSDASLTRSFCRSAFRSRLCILSVAAICCGDTPPIYDSKSSASGLLSRRWEATTRFPFPTPFRGSCHRFSPDNTFWKKCSRCCFLGREEEEEGWGGFALRRSQQYAASCASCPAYISSVLRASSSYSQYSDDSISGEGEGEGEGDGCGSKNSVLQGLWCIVWARCVCLGVSLSGR